MRKKYHIHLVLTLLTTLLILGQLFIFVNNLSNKTLAEGQYKIPTPTLSPPTSLELTSHPPHQQAVVTKEQASQTTITYQLPIVKLKVDTGDDLDQYLNATNSPLDFYIDLQGFKPSRTQATQLKLRVWDIDEEGYPNNPSCLVEVDSLYVNDIFLGNLSGANQQWSEIIFNIPPGSLTSGKNHFWIDIDILTPKCWSVKVDWAEITLPFNIAQVEASAFYDVKVKRGTSDNVITDPIWQAEFDSTGYTLLPTNINDPIADKITSDYFL